MQRALHRLSVMAATAPIPKEIPVPTPPPPPSLSPEVHRSLGVGLYNRAWDLLEIESRTPEQDDELVDTAHASAWHWRQVGNAANGARAHWLCSRVYAVLGRGESSLHHARRASEIVAAGGEGFEDWDDAAVAEAMARAFAVCGELAAAAEWKARASAALERVADPDDRAPIAGDLATIPV